MIFKATKDQNVPVSKYIKTVPDVVFISVRNLPLAEARVIIYVLSSVF